MWSLSGEAHGQWWGRSFPKFRSHRHPRSVWRRSPTPLSGTSSWERSLTLGTCQIQARNSSLYFSQKHCRPSRPWPLPSGSQCPKKEKDRSIFHPQKYKKVNARSCVKEKRWKQKNRLCNWWKPIQSTQGQDKVKIHSKMVWGDTSFLNMPCSFPSLLLDSLSSRPLILPLFLQ